MADTELAALDHLGDVLSILAELSPDERCKALDDAQAFYNAIRPDAGIAPMEGYESRLVSTKTPLGPTGLAAENAALSEALKWITEALDVDGGEDAYDNLDGALHDMKRTSIADPICIKTVRRVQKQIAEVMTILRGTSASDRSPQGRDGDAGSVHESAVDAVNAPK